jgi:hypothetical protein
MGRLADNISKRAQSLVDRLSRITDRLDRLIKEITTSTETSNVYWNAIQVEVRGLYEEARKISASWADFNIPIVYRDQIRRQFTKLKARQFSTKNDINYQSFVSSHGATQSLSALLGEINNTWMTGFLSGQRTLIRLVRLTQQYRVKEKQIEKAIAKGFLEGGPGVRTGQPVGAGSLYGINRSLITTLTDKALNGQYITIINKNGDPMSFNLKNYADLVARTKMTEASTQAVMNTTTALGEDLVQVSAHNTVCEICAQYEGKIYSLSGTDPDFPPVEDLPPYHTRCEHTISTVIKEGLIADGTLDNYIDFSNGDTEIHPTRDSFIPVSQREFK